MPSLFLFYQACSLSGVNASNLILTALIPKEIPKKDVKQEGCLYYWCSQSGSLQYLEYLQINLVYQLWHWTPQRCLLLEVMLVGQVAQNLWQNPEFDFSHRSHFFSFALHCWFLVWKRSFQRWVWKGLFHSCGHFNSSLNLLNVPSQCPSSINPCPQKGVWVKVHYFSTAWDNKSFDWLRLLCLLNFHHQIMFDTLLFPHTWNKRNSIREQRKY